MKLDVPVDHPELRDAANLLRKKGYKPSRVIASHVDGILWLDQRGDPQTTFVLVEEDKGKMLTSLSPPLRGFLVA